MKLATVRGASWRQRRTLIVPLLVSITAIGSAGLVAWAGTAFPKSGGRWIDLWCSQPGQSALSSGPEVPVKLPGSTGAGAAAGGRLPPVPISAEEPAAGAEGGTIC